MKNIGKIINYNGSNGLIIDSSGEKYILLKNNIKVDKSTHLIYPFFCPNTEIPTVCFYKTLQQNSIYLNFFLLLSALAIARSMPDLVFKW